PSRGAWIELETDMEGVIYVRIDKKRKFPVTTLLRAFGAATDKEILDLFAKVEGATPHIEKTLAKDHAKTQEDAFIEIHKRLRDGDLATAENAKEFFGSIFGTERYDLSKVGRFRFNNRFGKSMADKEIERRTISLDDLTTILA